MIEADRLFKSFAGRPVVTGVSFSVSSGEVLAFLGANGAGKTTTMRLVTGYLAADSGSVRLGGIPVRAGPVSAARQLGYLPENSPLLPGTTVGEFLSHAAGVRGYTGAGARAAVGQAMERCALEGMWHAPVDSLSKGYRHRTGLAQAILHDPPVLVLDEPTDGLDPQQKFEVRRLIRQMGHSKAILFSTHILEEVEAVCDRIVMIDRGAVCFAGTPEQMRASCPWRLVVELNRPPGPEFVRPLENLQCVKGIEIDGKAVMLSHSTDSTISDLEESVGLCIQEHGWVARRVMREPGQMERAFRAILRGRQ